VGSDEVETGNDLRGGSAAARVKNAHGMDPGIACHTHKLTRNGSGHMGAMSVAIPRVVAVIDCRIPRMDATTNLKVRSTQASVDYVHIDVFAGCEGSVFSVERLQPLVDPVDSPRQHWANQDGIIRGRLLVT
jgi:hypothetical protein